MSTELLKHVAGLTGAKGYVETSVDSTIIAEKPKLSPYIEQMEAALSKTGMPREAISIKAKTNEGMGFIGRGEGIAAYAVCLLEKI